MFHPAGMLINQKQQEMAATWILAINYLGNIGPIIADYILVCILIAIPRNLVIMMDTTV